MRQKRATIKGNRGRLQKVWFVTRDFHYYYLLCDSHLIKLNGWLPICTFTRSYDFFSSNSGESGIREYIYIYRIAKREKKC